MFKCRGCASKDDEIRWLRQRIEEMEHIKAETEKPGILRQVEPPAERPTPAAAVQQPKTVPASRMTFPGYEPAPPDEVQVT